MKKQKRSLRTGFLTTVLICWLVPILIVVILAGVMLGRNYRNSVQQEIDASATNALALMKMRMEDAISDSKAVSYDGVVRNAYRDFQRSGDSAALYSQVNNYLNQNFTREEMYRAVFVHFWEVEASAYVLSQGTTGYGLLRQCRECAPQILEEMADADTDIRVLLIDGQLYMARNLLDSTFTPYASVVMMLDADNFLPTLRAENRIRDMQYSIDDCVFRRNDAGELTLPQQDIQSWDISYQEETEDHVIAFAANLEAYNLWEENPWMQWAVVGVALLVLPLLVVTIVLFSRHVTRPMETLVQANLRVQSGQRGYEISANPPNVEFEKLYSHFNSMSAEMKNQFERSYLEQQATQKAQIKALQSQINPHFLNNTLEIINWEARIAENDRVSAMIEALSTMLNAALNRDGTTKIPLSEELGYVDAYLYIIRERLGSGFRVRQDIDPAVLEQMVPRLILQPIVENAVEHDITARHGGMLSLRAYRKENRMVLEVEHDGTMTESDRENIRKLLTTDADESGKVGLRNVYRRLKLLYGQEGTMTIQEVEHGSILAKITFPLT